MNIIVKIKKKKTILNHVVRKFCGYTSILVSLTWIINAYKYPIHIFTLDQCLFSVYKRWSSQRGYTTAIYGPGYWNYAALQTKTIIVLEKYLTSIRKFSYEVRFSIRTPIKHSIDCGSLSYPTVIGGLLSFYISLFIFFGVFRWVTGSYRFLQTFLKIYCSSFL